MTATLRLYEIAHMRDLLDAKLSETEGEVTPELEQQLDELGAQASEKIERVALYIREQLATAVAVKEEEARLSARRRSMERAAEGLKAYLQRNMEALSIEKVPGLLCTVALQNNPPSVKGEITESTLRDWFNEAADLSRFVRYIPAQYALDRRGVLEHYKATNHLPDGLTVEQGRSVRIR
jgi:hypothetical protein